MAVQVQPAWAGLLSLGQYPDVPLARARQKDVPLARARQKRDEARRLVADGVDPANGASRRNE